MRDGWSYLIIGVVLLIIGLALMNLPASFNGEVFVVYLGWALLVIGLILIAIGAIKLLQKHA
jgi:uncharacterized membrane protein HdeD (DUF308 family)